MADTIIVNREYSEVIVNTEGEITVDVIVNPIEVSTVVVEMRQGDPGAAGATGATGPQGPQGPPGEDGLDDKHYVHTQSVASDTWSITHNLGKYPSVTVVDSADTEVIGDVDYTSLNALTVTFISAFGGKAYLN